MGNIPAAHIHDTRPASMWPWTCQSRAVAGFVLLDAAMVVCLFSMLLCLRPLHLDFVSEWMRQCKYDPRAFFLPYLLTGIIVLVVELQLSWMFLVSLYHLNASAQLEDPAACQRRPLRPALYAHAHHHAHAHARTSSLALLSQRPRQPLVSVDGHADEAFMAGLAAVIGIVAVLAFDWTSANSWLHFYGVFLFCGGFLLALQIIWYNLQRACCVGSLRHIHLVSGMHWALDTGIVLFVLLFMTANFMLGQTGAAVVSSELIAFALLVVQFLYVFSVCSRSVPPRLPARAGSASLRLWFSLLAAAPFLLAANL
jgi:hypothetical protein